MHCTLLLTVAPVIVPTELHQSQRKEVSTRVSPPRGEPLPLLLPPENSHGQSPRLHLRKLGVVRLYRCSHAFRRC